MNHDVDPDVELDTDAEKSRVRWVSFVLRCVGLVAMVAFALVGSAAATHEGHAPQFERGNVVAAAARPYINSRPVRVAVARAPERLPAVARPVRLDIPSIAVATPLVSLGIERDGTMEVPRYEEAGWYDKGARPGEEGPAVIAAHVDSRSGPAVFARLHELLVGASVVVTRSDGSEVRFVVDRQAHYPKDAFPTEAVFGPTPGVALRLITCGGAFDESRGHYLENLVVFASLAPG